MVTPAVNKLRDLLAELKEERRIIDNELISVELTLRMINNRKATTYLIGEPDDHRD